MRLFPLASVSVAHGILCFGPRATNSVCLLLRRVLDPGCGRKDHCTLNFKKKTRRIATETFLGFTDVSVAMQLFFASVFLCLGSGTGIELLVPKSHDPPQSKHPVSPG